MFGAKALFTAKLNFHRESMLPQTELASSPKPQLWKSRTMTIHLILPKLQRRPPNDELIMRTTDTDAQKVPSFELSM